MSLFNLVRESPMRELLATLPAVVLKGELETRIVALLRGALVRKR